MAVRYSHTTIEFGNLSRMHTFEKYRPLEIVVHLDDVEVLNRVETTVTVGPCSYK